MRKWRLGAAARIRIMSYLIYLSSSVAVHQARRHALEIILINARGSYIGRRRLKCNDGIVCCGARSLTLTPLALQWREMLFDQLIISASKYAMFGAFKASIVRGECVAGVRSMRRNRENENVAVLAKIGHRLLDISLHARSTPRSRNKRNQHLGVVAPLAAGSPWRKWRHVARRETASASMIKPRSSAARESLSKKISRNNSGIVTEIACAWVVPGGAAAYNARRRIVSVDRPMAAAAAPRISWLMTAIISVNMVVRGHRPKKSPSHSNRHRSAATSKR